MAAWRMVTSCALLFLFLFCVNGVETYIDLKKKNALKELMAKKGYNIIHQNVRGLLLNLTSVQELISF